MGSWHLSFIYTYVTGFRLDDTCIWFVVDRGSDEIPVPLAKDGQADAEYVIAYYYRLFEEEARQAWEERLAPTWSNRLLNIVEAHFVWVVLGLFFIGIPVVVLIFVWLHGSLQ